MLLLLLFQGGASSGGGGPAAGVKRVKGSEAREAPRRITRADMKLMHMKDKADMLVDLLNVRGGGQRIRDECGGLRVFPCSLAYMFFPVPYSRKPTLGKREATRNVVTDI